MTRVRVGEILVVDEAGFACNKSKLVDEGLPHLRPFNIADGGGLDFTHVYHVPPDEAPNGKAQLLAGDILFNNTNSADLVGKSAVVSEPMVAGFSNHLTRVRVDKNRVDPLWFGFWLRCLRSTGYFTANATQWVSQAAYRTADLRKLEVEVPTLEEQRRIVDLLSSAEGIVRLRREAQAKAAEIIPALFLDMFGDPATNPKGWDICRLAEVAVDLRNGFNPPKGAFGNGIRFVTVNDLYGGLRIDIQLAVRVDATSETAAKYRLQRGDLCFVRSSVKRSGVGMVAVFDDDEPAIFGGFVIRVRLREEIEPLFVASMCQTPSMRNLIVERAGTGTITNINQPALSSLPMIVPPVAWQRTFVERCEVALSIRRKLDQATINARSALDGLLTRAFGSDLTAVSLAAEEAAVA